MKTKSDENLNILKISAAKQHKKHTYVLRHLIMKRHDENKSTRTTPN